ncbi:general secretion pathway protein M [Sphingomonas naasensis]|uniref:Type II secretion system protein M n=1 Tax=Sphingomonas naasensis TaxID=1344951 RepID=A0A4V3QWM7_9SPHN|nr:type II secretion system protein GspM [Sphingomonas naasensis]NIJ20762.1 general secretion pathway protein M [Sphingomonas naasensis]TGX43172.1 type II secretion system protein M [Sphingomonas naasensis]
MRILITRLPALDAALIRFDNWWSGLSKREQWLVGVLGGLLGLVVLVYGVVKPLQAARADAIADIRTYETLTARIRAAGTLTSTKPARREGPPAQILSGSATTFGLVAAPEAIPGGTRVTLADASYDSLMAWLADLGATSDLRVRRVWIRKRPTPGRVSASVDFGA